jgi:hypothetical protein
MERNILNGKLLMLGFIMIGMLAACDNQGDGTRAGDAPVDAVAEPVPTPPPGDVEEIRRDVNGVSALVQDYMEVKEAMVDDNYEQARQTASDMQNSLQESGLREEQRNELKGAISRLEEARDIEALRQQFHSLSEELYQVVKNNEDLVDETLYWQHCPMAMDGQGANWLSDQEQVSNPYMGQRMPRCGSVQEVINN